MKAIISMLSIISLIHLPLEQERNHQESVSLIRDHVQRIYTAELGVREKTGRNDGLRVETYLRHVNLKKGDPWCAAFVCWVFDQAGVRNPRTGWSPGLFPVGKMIWSRKVAVEKVAVAGREEVAGGEGVAGRKVAVAVNRKGIPLPQKGDVFGIWFPDKQRIAHVGFVDSWSDSWLITVEGNTNEAGSREGDGVLRKRRIVRSVWAVADWVR